MKLKLHFRREKALDAQHWHLGGRSIHRIACFGGGPHYWYNDGLDTTPLSRLTLEEFEVRRALWEMTADSIEVKTW